MSIRSTLIPSLLALAPFAHSAVEISDDVELKVSMRLQTRVEMANATDAADNDYDIWETAATDDPNQINMMIRRARLYLKGKYKDDIKFQLALYSDEIGANDDRDDTEVDVRYAWIAKEFKSGDIKHTIKFGLDKLWAISGDFDSSSKMLFATNRLTNQFNLGRQVGLSYKANAPLFNIGIDLSDDEEEGEDGGDLLYSFRFESSFSEDTMLKKRQESFLGKDGFGHLVGLAFGGKSDSDGDDDDYSVFSIDYNLHKDQLSLNADLVTATDKEGQDVDSLAFLVQAGWAIPMDAYVFEPAIRLSMIDLNTDNDDEAQNYDEEGTDASGMFLDLGANFYFDGHNNKLNVGFQTFTPEDGDSSATIFRIQHQLNF